MAERRKSQMQTLGANNEYGVAGMVNKVIVLLFSMGCVWYLQARYLSTYKNSNCLSPVLIFFFSKENLLDGICVYGVL